MELRALRAFVEVVRAGGFAAASERLFVTQPTVSKRIRQLEDELGHPLLHRGARQARPTEAGRIVLAHAEDMLRRAGDIEAELADLSGLRRGELRIGIPPLGPQLFGRMVGAYRLRHPQIELRLFEDGSRTITAALLDGSLELGGLLAPVDDPRLDGRMLIDDRLALLAPARSAWGRRRTVRLAELAEEPLILFQGSYLINDRILAACQQCGFTPDIAGRTGQVGFAFELVRSGVGVALLPGSQLEGLDPAAFAVCRLVEPDIPWRIDLAWLRDGYLSHAARAWLALLDDGAVA